MGGSQAKVNQPHVFYIQDWQPIEWEPYTNIKDPTFSSNFIVYAHKNNPNLQIQNQAQYISYLETYYDRKKLPTLVNSMHIEQTIKNNMCSTFYYAQVYIQRIHFRLFQLIEIPVQEGLYIIQAALEGYQKMFQKTGYFQLSSQMIGINKQGKVKVWVNKNFSKNFPEFNKIDHNKNQNDFIDELVRNIQVSIDYPNNIQRFSQFLHNKKKNQTFQSTRATLKQYKKNYRYSPQKSMKSIILWVKKHSNKPMHSNTQTMQQLKSSIYSSTSQKNTVSNKFYNPSKRTQFNKLKTRRNVNKIQVQTSKYINPYLDMPVDLNLNLKNIINGNHNSREKDQIYFNNQRQSEPNRRFVKNNPIIRLNQNKKNKKIDETQGKICIENNFINSNRTMNILPYVSFSYKSSGLFSPQNIDSRQNQWFNLKKSQKTISQASQKPKEKQYRKSLNFDIAEDLDQKMKFYYNNNDIYQIDSEIAKDLFSMTHLSK